MPKDNYGQEVEPYDADDDRPTIGEIIEHLMQYDLDTKVNIPVINDCGNELAFDILESWLEDDNSLSY